jgi:tetratricopeptide (TPR) repeat protein
MVRRQKALMEAHTAKDWPRVIALLDEMSELAGGDPGYQVEKFRVIAKNIGDYDRAYALAGRIVDESWDNAQMLNNVAWFIVDEQGLERRDLELAMKAAKRANELTDDQDGPILDTVARVYFEKGDLETALRYQRKAVEHAEQPMLQELKATLEKYERLAEKGT